MLRGCDLIGFVPTADADRARQFFVDVLGLEFVADDGFALVVRAASSTIRIVRMGSFTPLPNTILGWEVPELSATVERLTGAGVAFQRYPHLNQDALGIWTSPDGSQVAWFNDPDGNVLSLSRH